MAKQRFLRYRTLSLLAALALFAGCSADVSPYLSGDASLPVPPPAEPVKAVIKRRPWENWMPERDLAGAKLRQPQILAADGEYSRGNFEKAAAEYAAIKPVGLTPAERAALAMRLASTQLVNDQATRALTTLSTHFRSEGKSADAVEAEFALIFGYAYGRSGDIEQSLAWFSRADRTGPPGALTAAATDGATYFLHGVPTEKFEALDGVWSSDEFVHRLIGAERYRRESGGVVVLGRRDDELWLKTAPLPDAVVPLPAVSQATTVGVLLPLSGRFGALGTSTRNGIDLAMQGQADKDLLHTAFKDTGEDSAQALAAAQEALTLDQAPVVIGPLLSEQVSAVTGAVRQYSAAMVSFSKRSDVDLGEGVFRLGTTVDSQVSSLVQAAVVKLGLKRLAIVSPSDIAGQEYANVFAAKLRENGLEPVFQTSYPKDDMDALVGAAQQVEAQPVDAVFFPDSLTAAARFFSSLAPAARERIRPLGLATWDNPVQLANSRTVLSGAVFVSLFFAQSARPAVASFIRGYEDQFRAKPDFLAAQGFDAATLVAAAVDNQRSTGARFADALAAVGLYDGLTGRISVESNGEIRRTFAVVELQGEQVVELADPITPSFVMRGDVRLDGLAAPAADSLAGGASAAAAAAPAAPVTPQEFLAGSGGPAGEVRSGPFESFSSRPKGNS